MNPLPPEPEGYDLTQLRGILNANTVWGEAEALRTLRIYRCIVEARVLLSVSNASEASERVSILLDEAQTMLNDAIIATKKKDSPHAEG